MMVCYEKFLWIHLKNSCSVNSFSYVPPKLYFVLKFFLLILNTDILIKEFFYLHVVEMFIFVGYKLKSIVIG